MKRLSIFSAELLPLIFLGWFTILLTACAPFSTHSVAQNSDPTSGFGGTGLQDSSGFGGTGAPIAYQEDSQGFGGTGFVGTVTEFGSIWVNGVEVEYGSDLQIHSNLMGVTPELALGQQVVFETLAKQNAYTQAIWVHYPLAGQIEALSDSQLTVNGHQVALTSATLNRDAFAVGDYVAVSAYPQTAASVSWVATRLSVNPASQSFYQPDMTVPFTKAITQLSVQTDFVAQSDQWQRLANQRQLKLMQHALPTHWQTHFMQHKPMRPQKNMPAKSRHIRPPMTPGRLNLIQQHNNQLMQLKSQPALKLPPQGSKIQIPMH